MMNENVKYALYAAAGWSGYRLYTGQPIIPASLSSLFSSATAAPAGTVETPAGTLTSTGSETAAAIAAYYASIGQTLPPAIAAGIANGTITPAAAVAIANLYSPAKTTTATSTPPPRVAPTIHYSAYDMAPGGARTTARTPSPTQATRVPQHANPAAVSIAIPVRQGAAPVGPATAPIASNWMTQTTINAGTAPVVATPVRAAPSPAPPTHTATPVQTVNVVTSVIAATQPAPPRVVTPMPRPVTTAPVRPPPIQAPVPIHQNPAIPTPVKTAASVLNAIRATA